MTPIRQPSPGDEHDQFLFFVTFVSFALLFAVDAVETWQLSA
jgi:hypothetical protein